jgi:hypothetical protein
MIHQLRINEASTRARRSSTRASRSRGPHRATARLRYRRDVGSPHGTAHGIHLFAEMAGRTRQNHRTGGFQGRFGMDRNQTHHTTGARQSGR